MTKKGKSSQFSEVLLSIMKIQRTQEEQMQWIRNEIDALKTAVEDQTAVNTRLLNLLERNESATCSSSSAAAVSLDVTPYIKHAKKHVVDGANQLKERNVKFSWPIFAQLIKDHRQHMNFPALTESDIEKRLEHVKKIYSGVILYFKTTYGLGNTLLWSQDRVKVHHRSMFIKLEQEAASYIPLNYCIGHWGARLILSKHWQNVQQGNTRKTNHAGARDPLVSDQDGSGAQSKEYGRGSDLESSDGSSHDDSSSDLESSDESDHDDSNSEDSMSSSIDDGESSSNEDDHEELNNICGIPYDELAADLQRIVDDEDNMADTEHAQSTESGNRVETNARKRKVTSTMKLTKQSVKKRALKPLDNANSTAAMPKSSLSRQRLSRNCKK
ncbi:hypothetical protein BJV82DRAFT_603098 [Fennellomyces sp. T-0311]|nr:hypothetical protein BJV82DRAFT_603098 [Fennellomyces sp. T-0311]